LKGAHFFYKNDSGIFRKVLKPFFLKVAGKGCKKRSFRRGGLMWTRGPAAKRSVVSGGGIRMGGVRGRAGGKSGRVWTARKDGEKKKDEKAGRLKTNFSFGGGGYKLARWGGTMKKTNPTSILNNRTGVDYLLSHCSDSCSGLPVDGFPFGGPVKAGWGSSPPGGGGDLGPTSSNTCGDFKRMRGGGVGQWKSKPEAKETTI